jgi:hypothetical protein
MKEKLLKLIEKHGIIKVSELIGISVYQILKISDSSFVPDYDIINEILYDMNKINKIDFQFKEFNVYYCDGFICWDGSLKNIDDDHIFNIHAYVTPYYETDQLQTPIQIDYYEILDLEKHQIISDEIEILSDIDCPRFFDNVDSFENWFYKIYTVDTRAELIRLVRRNRDYLFPDLT